MAFTYALGGPGVSSLFTKVSNAATALVKDFRVTNQTGLAPDGSNLWTVTIANEEDTPEFSTFRETALPPGTSSVAEPERTREGGAKVGGGTSGGIEYILAVGGPVLDKGSGATRKLAVLNVTVDPTTGGSTQAPGAPTSPTLVFKSVKVTADTTLGFALIDAMPDADGNAGGLYDMGSGSVTILSGLSHKETWITKAA